MDAAVAHPDTDSSARSGAEQEPAAGPADLPDSVQVERVHSRHFPEVASAHRGPEVAGRHLLLAAEEEQERRAADYLPD